MNPVPIQRVNILPMWWPCLEDHKCLMTLAIPSINCIVNIHMTCSTPLRPSLGLDSWSGRPELITRLMMSSFSIYIINFQPYFTNCFVTNSRPFVGSLRCEKAVKEGQSRKKGGYLHQFMFKKWMKIISARILIHWKSNIKK